MGRAGCKNPGSLMPWPGSLAATAVRQSPASWSLLAPDRGEARRLVSVAAKRQLRTWPSAVSRTRSHVPQNGRVTDPMIPTRSRPPLTRKVSALLSSCHGADDEIGLCPGGDSIGQRVVGLVMG